MSALSARIAGPDESSKAHIRGDTEMATKNEFTWRAEPSWGCQGWDLGEWPLVVVSLTEGEDEEDGYLYGVKVNTEGDVERHWFTTSEARDRHVSEWARWWYFNYQTPFEGMTRGCLSWRYRHEFAASCPDCRTTRTAAS